MVDLSGGFSGALFMLTGVCLILIILLGRLRLAMHQ